MALVIGEKNIQQKNKRWLEVVHDTFLLYASKRNIRKIHDKTMSQSDWCLCSYSFKPVGINLHNLFLMDFIDQSLWGNIKLPQWHTSSSSFLHGNPYMFFHWQLDHIKLNKELSTVGSNYAHRSKKYAAYITLSYKQVLDIPVPIQAIFYWSVSGIYRRMQTLHWCQHWSLGGTLL